MHERPPSSNHPLPDANDPEALGTWIAGIENESARVAAKKRLVVEVSEAAHAMAMLRLTPLPAWATPADRHRAWGLVIIGMVVGFVSSASLAYLGPDDATALLVFPILGLLWVFAAAYEVARYLRTRSKARVERDQQVATARARHTTALALLAQHEAQHPPAP